MLLPTLTLLAAVTAPIAPCPAPTGDVIVVDAAGGGDHLQVQDAVDVAVPGDIVLVRAGTYAGFRIVGLGVTVVGDDVQPRPKIRGEVELRDVPEGETVVLSGLDIDGVATPIADGTAVQIVDCAGGVRIQFAALVGHEGAGLDEFPAEGVVISNSDDVALTDVQMRGGAAFSPTQVGFGDFAAAGAPGIWIESSQVVLQRCVVTGGDGGSWIDEGYGGDGGMGVVASFRTELILVHALINGGDGGDSGDIFLALCGRGGDAMTVSAFETDVRGRALTFVPGAGGTHVYYGNTCSPGSEVVGPFTYWNGNARALISAPFVRANTSTTTLAFGQPGDLVWRWFSSETIWQKQPARRGALLVRRSTPGPAQLLGRVPGGGTFQIVDRWRLPIGMKGLTFHTQSAFTAPGRNVSLGNTVAITVVDPAF